MKILTYRDLESKDDLLPLMDLAFGWPFNPRLFNDYVKIDPRLKNSPVGFCAMQDGHVIGFVGVLDMATRTLEGTVEYVGGIYGVATLPSHARKGISTTLMNEAHRSFKEKGYRFSFLNTSHTIIAHAFYEKLGYYDAIEYPTAYKVIKLKKVKSSKKEKLSKLDFDRILRIYNEFSEDKSGFVIRDRAYMKMLKKTEGITAKQCLSSERGYAIFRKIRGGIWIRELVTSDTNEMRRLISQIERKADLIYDRAVLNDASLQVYESLGYMIQKRSHGVMMAKPLIANASFVRTYGDKFYASSFDHF